MNSVSASIPINPYLPFTGVDCGFYQLSGKIKALKRHLYSIFHKDCAVIPGKYLLKYASKWTIVAGLGLQDGLITSS